MNRLNVRFRYPLKLRFNGFPRAHIWPPISLGWAEPILRIKACGAKAIIFSACYIYSLVVDRVILRNATYTFHEVK